MLILTSLLLNPKWLSSLTKVNAAALEADSLFMKRFMITLFRDLLRLPKVERLVIHLTFQLTKALKSIKINSLRFWDTLKLVRKKELNFLLEVVELERKVGSLSLPYLLMYKIT